MSVAPTAAGRRPAKKMSESGDPAPGEATIRVEDIERALVLAREVAAATSKGGGANLRMEHLLALFANGNGPPSIARIQGALEAAGLAVDPPLRQGPEDDAFDAAAEISRLMPSRSGKSPIDALR